MGADSVVCHSRQKGHKALPGSGQAGNCNMGKAEEKHRFRLEWQELQGMWEGQSSNPGLYYGDVRCATSLILNARESATQDFDVMSRNS